MQRRKILTEQAPIAPIYQYTNGRYSNRGKGIPHWLQPEDVAHSRTMYNVKHWMRTGYLLMKGNHVKLGRTGAALAAPVSSSDHSR